MEKEIERKALRIGIDGRVLQDAQRSGIPSYAYHVVKQIISSDKKNHYIIFFNSFRKIDKTIPEFDQENVEKKIYHFPNKILEWIWKIFPYPKIDKILNVDIFFSPHFLNIPLTKKVKKIVTIHDLSFEKNKNYFSFKKNLWHWQMNPRRICKFYDKIIAVSSSTKKDLENIYKIKKEKIKIIHNGTILDNGKPNNFDDDTFKKYNIEKEKYALFISTLEPRKNIEGILDALFFIKKELDIKLVVAGKKGWTYKNIFKKLKNNKLEAKVVFTGFISEEEKNALYKNANFFIFPSFYEGFGIPILEAKNFLLPTITSITSSLPEITKDSAIILNPHNIYDIAQSLKILNTDKKMGFILKNKMECIENKQWDTVGRETLEYILN